MNILISVVSKRESGERGSALVEFSLVVPLLLLFTFGLFQFGRVFSNLTWVAQTSYNTALKGSEIPEFKRNASMQIIGLGLLNIHNHQGSNHPLESSVMTTGTVGVASGENVEARLSGDITKLIAYLPMSLSVGFDSPVLLIDSVDLTSRAQFTNPAAGEIYNCAAARSAGGSSVACNVGFVVPTF